MDPKRFNYYGYDKNTYLDCQDLINATNRKHVEIIMLWFAAVNIFYFVFSIFNFFGVNRSRTFFYGVFVGISVAFLVVFKIFGNVLERYETIVIYLCVILLMIYSILESNANAFSKAAMFPVLLVLVGLSFIDNMMRMTISLVVSTVVLIIESHRLKPISIFNGDTYNAVIFLTLALVLHFFFQRARMSQFETFRKNIQITQELEVKSSFDALTSLLNRGRFFSMAGQIIRAPHEEGDLSVALLDLDGFKQINDTLGHQMGDKVIQIVGSSILEFMKIDQSEKWSFPERAMQEELSFAGRLGGDEFIILIRGKENNENIKKTMESLLKMLNSVETGGLHGIHASIGVTRITDADKDIDKAYNRVDDGLYQSKRQGKNRVTFVD
ncbi:MAG: GGDEF domain-containing protein [Lachnospiraceae bacterium]|nr:GGDEF domain-containing protein [Lachnospiraceae bacterium]